ncbi:MAG: PEGA domain-containing protein [Ignavibacteriae bacterium]|nr:PEGA domain-containing protein [Ignavibacteriota bacterium]
MNNKLKSALIFCVIIVVFVSCDREVSVSDPQQYETGTAQLYISSIPEGALIFVDGKNYGQHTPDTVKWLTSGTHDFKLKLDSYLDFSFTKSIEENTEELYEHNFNTDPVNFGVIKFFSNPNYCTVYINDTIQSFTPPYTLQFVLPGKYKIKYTYPEHRSDSLIVSVVAARESYCSMALEDTSIFVSYKTQNSLMPDNWISSIAVDDENNIWIGTKNNGVVVKRNNDWEFINTGNSNLPHDAILKIKKDHQNNIWIATNSGLAKMSNNLMTVYKTDNSDLPNDFVNDMDFDASGNIWIGTLFGLAKFDGIANWTVYRTSNSTIPANFVTAVLIDKTDSLWIGTNAFKTAKFDYKNKWTTFQSEPEAPNDGVIALAADLNNNIWVGLSGNIMSGKVGGVYVIQNNIMGKAKLSIPYEDVFDFYVEDNNTVWISTSVGFYSATSKDNIKFSYSGSINSSHKDLSGNLWIGTNDNGIVKYKKWEN